MKAPKSAILFSLIIFTLLSGYALADTDTTTHNSTAYRFGSIFDHTNNKIHWNGSVSYNPAPDVADEMDVAVSTSIQ